jgi:DNA-binding transcriptional ArsR family regulator
VLTHAFSISVHLAAAATGPWRRRTPTPRHGVTDRAAVSSQRSVALFERSPALGGRAAATVHDGTVRRRPAEPPRRLPFGQAVDIFIRMGDNTAVAAEGLDLTFHALSDASRRAIVRDLRRGERRITEIARPFPVALNTVSKHVKVLERAGLVRRRVRGREHYITLAPEPLRAAAGWIEAYRAFWEARLDALEALLSEEEPRGGG